MPNQILTRTTYRKRYAKKKKREKRPNKTDERALRKKKRANFFSSFGCCWPHNITMECWLLEDVVERSARFSTKFLIRPLSIQPTRSHTSSSSITVKRERKFLYNIQPCVCVCETCKRLFISTAAPRPSQKKRLEHKTIFIYTHTHTSRHSVSSFAVRLFERMPFSFLIFFNLVILLLILPFLFFSLVT